MNNELDDMKRLWQTAPDLTPGLESAQLLDKLSARSKDALTKLRRNLYLEAALGVFATLAFAALALNTTNLSSRFALIQLALLMTPFLFFYYLAHKNLRAGISFNKPLRQTLQDSVRFWMQGLRLYFWGGMLLLPVILIAAGWWRMSLVGIDHIWLFSGKNSDILLRIGVIWGLVGLLVWGLIYVSYGIHVRRLKKCLAELMDDENE